MTESQYNSVNDQRYTALLRWLTNILPAVSTLSPLATDAGMRRYYRVHTADTTLIAVDADPVYEDSGAFIDIASRISNAGLHTPGIYHYNLENGFLVVEDLGDQHLQDWLRNTSAGFDSMYQIACDAMITLQQSASTTELPTFNRDFILFELSIFNEWYLQRHLRFPTDDRTSDVICATFDILVDNCEQQPQAFMHRDFHSRNLMVTGARDIAIIDFQGAMLGPVTYDLGSLLKDAYVHTPANLEQTLCEQHRVSLTQQIRREDYERWYRLTALQRHLKILGLFCRLHYRDGKPQYLTHLKTVAAHIIDTLDRYAEFDEFSSLFNQFSSMSNHS